MPSLAAAAVSQLPAEHYVVGAAANQATREVGGLMGVAITVGLLDHASLTPPDFNGFYALHAALALIAGLLCLPVNTRPR